MNLTVAKSTRKSHGYQTGALSKYDYNFDKAQKKILKYGTEKERYAILTKIMTSSIGDMNEAFRTNVSKTARSSSDLTEIKAMHFLFNFNERTSQHDYFCTYAAKANLGSNLETLSSIISTIFLITLLSPIKN